MWIGKKQRSSYVSTKEEDKRSRVTCDFGQSVDQLATHVVESLVAHRFVGHRRTCSMRQCSAFCDCAGWCFGLSLLTIVGAAADSYGWSVF